MKYTNYLLVALMALVLVPSVLAVHVGSGVGIDVSTEEFAPRVWACSDRVVMDDAVEPGRISADGTRLVERTNNYAFEGEQVQWNVLVMDKNKIDQNIDVYATVGDVQGEGNPIEVNCQRVSSSTNISSCNARIDEEKLTTLNPDTMAMFQCTLTVETSDSMAGEYWVTVEAQDGEGNLGTMDENEYWFMNPVIALSIDGVLAFEDVRPGTDAYSSTLLVGNDAEDGSGVMLDMFISGTDFYDSSSSGARCEGTNSLLLKNFKYFVTSGAYSSRDDLRAKDTEGYVGINYGNSFANEGTANLFYGSHEILQAGGAYTGTVGYKANVLAPGAEMSMTFKLTMPEPCTGDFDTGSIFFWGEAI